jgi:N-acetylglutamate synthase-like GNAT family acetyltransferase
MINIYIRDANVLDLPAINELLLLSKGHWGYDQEFLDKFLYYLGLTPQYLHLSTTKLLFAGDDLVGFYSLILNKSSTLDLDHFFIHPKFIGQGWGKKLWIDCCKTTKELGKKEFTLWSDPHAENFYIKLGCKKVGKAKSDLAPNRYLTVYRYKIKE